MNASARDIRRLQTLHSLRIDQVIAEVVEALEAARITVAVAKGPTFVRWLYSDGAVRPYGDGDLLVPADQLAAAQDVMRQLGFARRFEAPGANLPKDHAWQRADDVIDLDSTLHGIRADDRAASEILLGGTEPIEVSGRRVRMLDEPRRALHVALHAAQHGRMAPKPLTDLQRALDVCGPETWREAAEVAGRLDALPAFVAGLRLAPAGKQLIGELGLPRLVDVRTAVEAETAPYAVFFEDLAEASPRVALRRVREEVFPSADFLRWWLPLARRGPVGLAAARLWRPVWLLTHAVPALRAWRRARRQRHA